MSWNPSQYLQYEDARLRPALDLLARIRLDDADAIVDLGCGTGNVARVLASRWPRASITGVDADDAMLERAAASTVGDARFRWVRADIGRYEPDAPPALIYSNAALHWLDDHAALFPTLLSRVAPGGVLAVQMPDNFRAPSHVELFALARSPRWRERLADRVREAPVAPIARYVEWLARDASVDAWSTEYVQILAPRPDGEHPVVAWNRGSALTPFFAALDDDARAAFVSDYAQRIASAYPLREDGSVLFPFRRIFIVAMRSGH